INTTTATTSPASYTHYNAINSTQKSYVPIGDTSNGRHGKKNRRLLNGEKNATPRPPFVIASRIGCDTTAVNTYAKAPRVRAKSAANSSANTIECVNPRCPNMLPYG